MSGDRQLVRNAVASYFGGTLQTADAGVYYQGGSLSPLGLGTAYPYPIKTAAPDGFYTIGVPAGFGWGAVLTVRLGETRIGRKAMGGPHSGWRLRRYEAICDIEVISQEPHLETAEAGLDDLVDALIALIYADHTLGTTNAALYPNPPYFGNRLIEQAAEGEFGETGITVGEMAFMPPETRGGHARGGIAVSFNVDNYVQS